MKNLLNYLLYIALFSAIGSMLYLCEDRYLNKKNQFYTCHQKKEKIRLLLMDEKTYKSFRKTFNSFDTKFICTSYFYTKYQVAIIRSHNQ